MQEALLHVFLFLALDSALSASTPAPPRPNPGPPLRFLLLGLWDFFPAVFQNAALLAVDRHEAKLRVGRRHRRTVIGVAKQSGVVLLQDVVLLVDDLHRPVDAVQDPLAQRRGQVGGQVDVAAADDLPVGGVLGEACLVPCVGSYVTAPVLL